MGGLVLGRSGFEVFRRFVGVCYGVKKVPGFAARDFDKRIKLIARTLASSMISEVRTSLQ